MPELRKRRIDRLPLGGRFLLDLPFGYIQPPTTDKTLPVTPSFANCEVASHKWRSLRLDFPSGNLLSQTPLRP